MLHVATIENFDEGVVEASLNKLVLVDFWTPWCGPCKMLRPVLDRIVTEIGDKVDIATVDVSSEEYLAEKYQIAGTPTVLFFKDGEPVHQFTGVRTKVDLLAEIEKYL